MQIKNRILSDRLKYNGKYPFWLTKTQRSARNRYLQIIQDDDFIYHDKCAICNSDQAILIAAKERRGLPANIYLCKDCGILFKNPVLNEKAAQRHYEEISYFLRGKTYSIDKLELLFQKRVKQFATKRYELLTSKISFEKGDLIVEIGCNDGANLAPWHNAGYEVIGFDWDDTLLEFGRKKGLRLLKGDASLLTSLKLRPKLIILSHVLEHLKDPIAELKSYRVLLEPDGYIFIEVPGIKEWCKDFLDYFDIEHNFYFNLEVLKRISIQCGYSLEYSDEHIQMIIQGKNAEANDTYIVNEKKLINMNCLRKIEDEYRNNIKYFIKKFRFLLINYFLLPVDDWIPIPNFILSLLRIR